METEFVVRMIMIGVGGTLFMDLWSYVQRALFGTPSLDYRMVGRWLGHIPKGTFAHDSIGQASPIVGEGILGWGAHYLIGVLFAGLLLAIWGMEWAYDPTLWPALVIGIATVLAPFLIMQPALGAGVAASKTPRPNISRRYSLIAHFSFGLGLYLAAVLSDSLWPTG